MDLICGLDSLSFIELDHYHSTEALVLIFIVLIKIIDITIIKL